MTILIVYFLTVMNCASSLKQKNWLSYQLSWNTIILIIVVIIIITIIAISHY